MNTQVEHHHGRGNTEEPPNKGVHPVVEREEEHHGHDKHYVLKKVKEKAKKIKETIKKHGHGFEHEHEHEHDDQHDVHEHHDVGDDEDEEMVQDPDIHGAPIVYDSAAIRNTGVIGQEGNMRQHGDNLGRVTAMQEDSLEPKSNTVGIDETDLVRRNTPPVSHTPGDDTQNVLEEKGSLGKLMHLKEDPHAPKDQSRGYEPGNYQSKVTDPIGQNSEEASGITPILQSLNKMSVCDKPNSKEQVATGSHDQFSPQLSPPMQQEANADVHEAPQQDANQSSYAGKLSLATAVLADKAVSAKNVVASKLGYGEQKDDEERKKTQVESPKQSSYTDKVSAATSTVADKAISAKNIVAAKLGYCGEHKSEESEKTQTEPPPKQSSYTEKVSSATSAVADKAINAKNAVVSKLGYSGGGKEEMSEHKPMETGELKQSNVGGGSWVEKLKPGEEDKALSEVISDVLLGRKKADHLDSGRGDTNTEDAGKSVKERISDELHKRGGQEEVAKESSSKPMGKVTESEQVAKRLGTGEEISGEPEGNRMAVVDKIKGAVSSWWNTGGQASQESKYATDEEKKLQESGN